ncbi:MAG: beta-N-acetylhexosaminidase [Ardenticatenaceae bacterium]|nr:beta-N-acetylhexosaminidase [Ardenticatenaceae bacterium]MCB8950141.1 beta-N-acetylhexosaminidase [Ardenticatenaceae bacterium]
MPETISIIPRPKYLRMGNGRFTLNQVSTIACSGEGALAVGHLLAYYLRPATGFAFPVTEGHASGTIRLEATGTATPDEAGFVDERYTLTVNDAGVSVKAQNATGLTRGIQSLRQLLPTAIMADAVQEAEWVLPAVEIEDAPRFRWRGQHLDVSRHFFTVDEVCQFIDFLALHRLNICHLHLTDDQGWRIEIKKYPRLTEIGSRRESTLIGHESDRPRRYDQTPYGGFYTQEEIKQIVDFAARRHITLVPEIDMPGHMVAAIIAYPELGNFKTETRVRCHWGISQSVLNVEESTIAFMKDVLAEVMALFPGRFIHVGGDEAPKFEWSESERAQARMAELGLHNEEELQSWFIRQMDSYIAASGRRLIGWDEILEGGLAAGAAVMSWRGEEGGIEAASHGHDVVMAPNQRVYFDHYQSEPTANEPLAIGGLTTLASVYAYDPMPEALSEKHRHHVLGGQGQIWTEYIPTMEHVEYMGFPRICALAEVLWLEKERKDYADFRQRLYRHRERLDYLGVNAHPE